MATYSDYTSLVSSNVAGDYTTLGSYNTSAATVPQSSMLKLSVAPSNQKYFSTAPTFEQRLDNFRIPQPASVPVSLTSNDAGYTPSNGAYALAGPSAQAPAVVQMNRMKLTPY